MPDPIDDAELYNYVVLGGMRSPGVVTLSGHDRKIDWDIKAATGQAGATMTRKGNSPIEFTASFYLVRDVGLGVDDIFEWSDFADKIRSTIAGKTPKALDIYHPDLAANGVKSVVMKALSGAKYDRKGGVTYDVQLIEYFPPKPARGAPKKVGNTKKPDPDAAALAELASLTAQYKSTPWG